MHVNGYKCTHSVSFHSNFVGILDLEALARGAGARYNPMRINKWQICKSAEENAVDG